MRQLWGRTIQIPVALAVVLAVVVATPAHAQRTVARLNSESAADIPLRDGTAETGVPGPSSKIYRGSKPGVVSESARSRAAAEALFVHSNLRSATALAARALHQDHRDLEALFVLMEAAMAQGDTASALDTAVRICELTENSTSDPRVAMARARLRDAARNTSEFRSVVPRLKALDAGAGDQPLAFSQILLNAALDGVPGLDAYAIARGAGILIDWRILGPVAHAVTPLELTASLAGNDFAGSSFAGRTPENYQFPDGTIVLPDYMPHRGTYYASSGFASFGAGSWTILVRSFGQLEFSIDGRTLVLNQAGSRASDDLGTATLELPPGPHRVVLKFPGAAKGIQVWIRRAVQPEAAPSRAGVSAQEAAFLTAALAYAEGNYQYSISALRGMEERTLTVPLRLLLTQAEQALRESPATEPSYCQIWQAARSQSMADGDLPQAEIARQNLQQCGPESLAYAEALAEDGRHDESTSALRQLLLASPLNRPARQMLIRELQLAGDDTGAQQAAAEWRRIAPNAAEYHRLAATADANGSETKTSDANGAEFYKRYRRDAALFCTANPAPKITDSEVLLLNDRVALARADGSVSVYVHTLTRLLATEAVELKRREELPTGARLIARRRWRPDNTTVPFQAESLEAGDAVEEEYMLNFSGDGGISEHPEAFQFVFGSFNTPILDSRFVVLTPAAEADRGVVIATGAEPEFSSEIQDDMLARIWERKAPCNTAADNSMAIIRVVDQENGWTIPRSTERTRRIETIHPGPRLEES